MVDSNLDTAFTIVANINADIRYLFRYYFEHWIN